MIVQPDCSFICAEQSNKPNLQKLKLTNKQHRTKQTFQKKHTKQSNLVQINRTGQYIHDQIVGFDIQSRDPAASNEQNGDIAMK